MLGLEGCEPRAADSAQAGLCPYLHQLGTMLTSQGLQSPSISKGSAAAGKAYRTTPALHCCQEISIKSDEGQIHEDTAKGIQTIMAVIFKLSNCWLLIW